jgi:hypothetical protein
MRRCSEFFQRLPSTWKTERLDRTLRSEGDGHTFESCQAHQLRPVRKKPRTNARPPAAT